MRIFRKIALERLASPEQLDQLLRVTDPLGWLSLLAMLVLLGAVSAWAFVGTIPTEVEGEGLLLRRGGVTELVAATEGQVEEILVSVGDQVHRGDVVARIRQEGLTRRIEEVEIRRDAKRAEYEDLLVYAAEERRLTRRDQQQERANLERSIETTERQAALLEDRIAAQRELLSDGLITRQTLLATEQELNQARDRLASLRLELSGLDLETLETEQELERQLALRRNELRDLDLDLRELQGALRESVEVVSTETGRVLELAVDPGDVASPGTPILSMEVSSEDLIAVLYVPASQGKRIRTGMEVRISPSNVRREEHGYMVGRVSWLADYPATSRGMLRLMGNRELVERLLERGPPTQVEVELLTDRSTPSGFRWSSSSGPDQEITSGTLTSGSIIVDEDRPISLLLPRVRSALGS